MAPKRRHVRAASFSPSGLSEEQFGELDRHHLFDDPEGFATRLIYRYARSLIRRPEFRGTDVEDLAQDLMLDVVRRLPRYDVARAKLTTFLFRLIEREMADLVEKATAKKRRGRRREEVLNGETVTSEKLRRHRGTTSVDGREKFEREQDLAAALKGLSPHLRARCELLKEHSPSAIAEMLGIPPEAVQDDIERIRSHFVDHGLDDFHR